MKKLLLVFASLCCVSFAQAQQIVDSLRLFKNVDFKSCHASSIVETRQGDLVVAFFAGSWEGCNDVCIMSCRKDHDSSNWTSVQKVAQGPIVDGIQHPCWNPVLCQLPGRYGDLMLFYKTGLTIPSWVGHTLRSRDGGKTWGRHSQLRKGMLGAIKNKPIRLGRRIIAPSSTESPYWHPHFEITDDTAKTWRKVSVPADSSIIAIQPTILKLSRDTLMALCRTKNGYLASTYSYDRGSHWSSLKLTNLPSNNSGIDAITLRDGRHVMVYNPLGLLPGSEFGARTPLVLSLSSDGFHWSTVLVLEDQDGEYSYPAIIEGRDGYLHVTYTWQRTHIKYVKIKL